MIEYSEHAIRAILVHKPPIRYDGVVYERAISLKLCVARGGKFVRSLELVKRRERADGIGSYETIVWAPIEECEVVG